MVNYDLKGEKRSYTVPVWCIIKNEKHCQVRTWFSCQNHYRYPMNSSNFKVAQHYRDYRYWVMATQKFTFYIDLACTLHICFSDNYSEVNIGLPKYGPRIQLAHYNIDFYVTRTVQHTKISGCTSPSFTVCQIKQQLQNLCNPCE